MRKIILGLALALLLLPTLGLAGGLAPSGMIIDNQGQQITVERFDKLMGSYPFVYEDSESKIPMSDVESLTLQQRQHRHPGEHQGQELQRHRPDGGLLHGHDQLPDQKPHRRQPTGPDH